MLYFNHCISDITTGNNWTISACDGPLDNVDGITLHDDQTDTSFLSQTGICFFFYVNDII